MFKKRLKYVFLTALTALFLFSSVSCSHLGINIEKNETTEFVIKQVGRGLGYKVSDRNPSSVCDVKKACDTFLAVTGEEEYSEEEANIFAKTAIEYLKDQIHVEDEILTMSLQDLADLVKIDIRNIEGLEIDDDNMALVRLAVKSYLEGLNVVAEQRIIECE